MERREYFYKDAAGVTQVYKYCSMCDAGPFKEEDRHREGGPIGKYVRVCSHHLLCIRCVKLKGVGSLLGGVPNKQREMVPDLCLKWVVFFIKCSDGTLHCNITSDIRNRMLSYNSGDGPKFLKKRWPVKLVYSELIGLKEDAVKRREDLSKMTLAEQEALIASGAPL